jgi:hypothetical protein
MTNKNHSQIMLMIFKKNNDNLKLNTQKLCINNYAFI